MLKTFGWLALVALLFASCGSDNGESEQAACEIGRSELGPFADDTPLGESMTDDEARARMAQDQIVEWLEITATGPWDASWETATASLGQGIHTGLTWLDLDGEISGLYRADDAFAFEDLRVSRSFQGKIEHSDAPLYLPLQDVGVEPDFNAGCRVTGVHVGDETSALLLDVTPEQLPS